jgi:hypothetical protein
LRRRCSPWIRPALISRRSVPSDMRRIILASSNDTHRWRLFGGCMADVMVAERVQHSGPRLRQAPHATVYQCAGHDLSSTHGFRTGPERLSVRLLHSKPHLFTAECWTLSRLAATILPRANHPPTSRQHPPEIRQSQQGAEENRENASDQRERLVAIVIFIMTSPPPARPWHGGRAKKSARPALRGALTPH